MKINIKNHSKRKTPNNGNYFSFLIPPFFKGARGIFFSLLLSALIVSSCSKAFKQGAPIDLMWKAGSSVITSSAEIKNGFLWAGTFDKRLLKISLEDGKLSKEIAAGSEVYFKPVITDKFIYFSTFDKKLIKCDTDLNILTQITLPDRASSDMKISDSLLVIPIRNKGIAVYETGNLKLRYEIYPGDSSYIDSDILTSGNVLFSGGIHNGLSAINIIDGKYIFKKGLQGYVYSKPFIFSDFLYFASDTSTMGGYIASYSLSTGSEQNRTASDMQVFFGFAADSSRLFYSSLSQNIVAIDPVSLKKLWEYDQMGDESATKLTEYKGRIYFGTTNKIIVCLNSATGRVIFKKAINYSAGRAIVYGGNVYFFLSDGSLYKVVY